MSEHAFYSTKPDDMGMRLSIRTGSSKLMRDQFGRVAVSGRTRLPSKPRKLTTSSRAHWAKLAEAELKRNGYGTVGGVTEVNLDTPDHSHVHFIVKKTNSEKW